MNEPRYIVDHMNFFHCLLPFSWCFLCFVWIVLLSWQRSRIATLLIRRCQFIPTFNLIYCATIAVYNNLAYIMWVLTTVSIVLRDPSTLWTLSRVVDVVICLKCYLIYGKFRWRKKTQMCRLSPRIYLSMGSISMHMYVGTLVYSCHVIRDPTKNSILIMYTKI